MVISLKKIPVSDRLASSSSHRFLRALSLVSSSLETCCSIVLWVIFGCGFLCCHSLQAQGNPFTTQTLTLDNGLTVILNEDLNVASVLGLVVVDAGGKDCGDTGLAHYLEHLLFKGTDEIASLDYAKEKPLLDSISILYDQLAVTTSSKEIERISSEINSLSRRAAAFAIPNEYDRLISYCGGSGLNAGTSSDYTMYYNTFQPEYINQWLQINSDRLLNPVVRLFQSELETVYEEKNMYADDMLSSVVETIQERFFKGHPYAYPVIGTTEKLKHPQISKMMDFFNRYYVAQNMALVLSGNFNAKEVIPLLEQTFGRLRPGQRNIRSPQPIPYHGAEEVKVLVNIPLIKAMGLLFDQPSAKEDDALVMSVIASLMTNDNSTGLADQLMNEHKLLAAIGVNLEMSDAGLFALVAIPKLIFGTNKGAEKELWKVINQVKAGDIDLEKLAMIKDEIVRQRTTSLEDNDTRAMMMAQMFTQGRTLDDYMADTRRISDVTVEDITRVANKYFNDNYLKIVKKKGSPKKDKLSQPGYEPIENPNAGQYSAYARGMISQMDSIEPQMKVVDFEKDVERIDLGPLSKLYTHPNPFNDYFTLNLSFLTGSHANPMMQAAVDYISQLGTDSLRKEQVGAKFQKIGASVDFNCTPDKTIISLTGKDENFDQTLEILADLLQNLKTDSDVLGDILDGEKMSKSTAKSSPTEAARALLSYVAKGDNSAYLRQPSSKEIKNYTESGLIDLFRDKALKKQNIVSYAGNLNPEKVKESVLKHMPMVSQATEAVEFHNDPLKEYSLPTIYFYNLKNTRQSVVALYQTMEPEPTLRQRTIAKAANEYFGAGMSSVLFQEARELRSLAYGVQSLIEYPSLEIFPNEKGMMLSLLSTQADKTIQAVTLLDSLMNNAPIRQSNIEIAKISVRNDVYNSYPSFRAMPSYVASEELIGNTEDPRKAIEAELETITAEEIAQYLQQKVANRTRAIIIVGDKKKIDMKSLSKIGNIVELKFKDFYK